MEDLSDNPIIQRLKQFMSQTGLTSTQFADKASIPRPTLSQMLHGRNKSINNQVLAKLDENFPELNIVWLLFGRGDMYANPNFKSSERQNDSLFGLRQEQKAVDDVVRDEEEAPYGTSSKAINANAAIENTASPLSSASGWTASVLSTPPEEAIRDAAKSISTDPGKRISSIIVLYTDNSFETFTPSVEQT